MSFDWGIYERERSNPNRYYPSHDKSLDFDDGPRRIKNPIDFDELYKDAEIEETEDNEDE